jgi:dipeptidyl-peptidase-4
LLQLEVADISPLLEIGWTMPVPYCSTAADGKTLLYSLLWPPHTLSPTSLGADAEPSRPDGNSYDNRVPRVPVLEIVYPGPHSGHTPKRFSAVACSQCAAAAALGFAVVFIDGRGTGLRSREFREHSHKNLGGGVDDHPKVIRDMAAEHPNIGMDLERVGIWGHSAGGYASAHAILKFPEFYKVAVSNEKEEVSACLHHCMFPMMVA